MSSLSKILIKKRESKNLTQDEVSKLIGMSLRTYQYYEDGTVTPKPKTLKLLATALNFKLSDIYLDEEESAKKLHDKPVKQAIIDDANVGDEISRLYEIAIKQQAAINLLMKAFEGVSAKAVEKEYERLYDEYLKKQ